jgi:predicted nucleotidyltransferase
LRVTPPLLRPIARSTHPCLHRRGSIYLWNWLHDIARVAVKLQKDLREFVELLLSRSVEFVVVGGHAVAFHGYARLTDDVDLFVRPTLENGARLVSSLEEFGFGSIGVTAETFTHPDRVIQLGRPPNRIDLLTNIYGVTFDEVWSSRVAADLDGLKVFMIGRDALIKNKRATGRAQDIADVEKLDPK